jgi:hypothetical protein
MKTFQTFRCPVQVLEATVVDQLPKSEIYWNRFPPAVTTTSSFSRGEIHYLGCQGRIQEGQVAQVQPPGEGQFSTAEALSKTGKSTNQLTHTHIHTRIYIYIHVCRCIYIYMCVCVRMCIYVYVYIYKYTYPCAYSLQGIDAVIGNALSHGHPSFARLWLPAKRGDITIPQKAGFSTV